MNSYLSEFTEYLAEKKALARNSLLAYERDVRGFYAFLQEKGITDFRDVTKTEVVAYLLALKNQDKSAATVNRKLASLRAFFQYLESYKGFAQDPTEGIKSPKIERKKLEYLTVEEVEKLLAQPDDSVKGRRDRALLEAFGLTDIQAQAILDMRLARLQGLEREKIDNEYADLLQKIAWYKRLLSNESELMNVIKEELLEIKNKFADKRRTKIMADAEEIEEEDLIQEENVAITLTHLGYIKRVSADTYKTQRRGGRGITGLTTRDNDFVKDLIITSTHNYLMFITNTGKAHRIKAYEVPEANRTAKGTPAVNFLNLMPRERITAVIPIEDFSADKYLVGVTKNGIIKKTEISQFDTNRKTGLIAIRLKDGDELIGIKETTSNSNIIIVTKFGKCICFNENDVRPMGRLAGGVRAITLGKGDEVVAMGLAKEDEELLVVTQGGFGKRTAIKEYKVQARGGKGLLTYDKSKFDKTGALIGAIVVNEQDEIFLINSDGIIIRIRADEVSKLSRATQGVKIMRVEEDSNIIALAKVVREDEDEEKNGTPETPVKNATNKDNGDQIKLDVE
jgi:DNA gyrase subunit A